jgi:DNA primase
VENIYLHPDTIAEVKERVDLVEVVSDYVVLQKKGREFIGLCPFHEEKTPSFTVNPIKQVYYCFGCGEGGGAIKFLMEIGKQSFREVILNLAQNYQIPIKTLAPEYQQEIQKKLSLREQFYEILAVASSFFQHSLWQPEGKIALKYLQEQRHLTKENIELFKLGYAPDSWETLYHYLVEIKHYPVMLVEQVGLIQKRKKGEGYIDYFRHRLMIPIHDQQGRIIAFGARSLDGNQPKYLNSPDTDLFAKNKTLFALDIAKKSIIEQDQLIIVEGYFDVIALHLAGIKNTVAILGTALTANHLKQLSRYTESKQIIVNFDADKAGLKATERAIKEVENLVYSGQLQLKILTIPDGKDADEFLHSQVDAVNIYQELITQAPLWLDWQIQQIMRSRNLGQSTDYEIAFQELVRLLSKISKTSTRDYYLSYCAELLCGGRNQLGQINNYELPKVYQSLLFALKQNYTHNYHSFNQNKVFSKSLKKTSENIQIEQAEFLLLLLYLHCPNYREEIINLLDEKDLVFSLKIYRFLWQQIQNIPNNYNNLNQENNNFLLATIQENMINYPEIGKQLINLFNPDQNHKQKLFNPQTQLKNAIACLETIKLEKYKQHCQQKILEAEKLQELEKINFYYQELIASEQQINQLKNLRKI